MIVQSLGVWSAYPPTALDLKCEGQWCIQSEAMERRMKLIVLLLTAGLFISVSGCANERMAEQNPPPAYGQRDPFDPRVQRAPSGPWDLRQNQQQLGPPTWYGCPQQSPKCYPD